MELRFGCSCTIACNTGYAKSSTGVDTVTCQDNGQWSGSQKTCVEINECTANTHSCVAPATCTNTAGSFTCNCTIGTPNTDGKSCIPGSFPFNVATTNSTVRVQGLDLHTVFTRYRATIQQWGMDKVTLTTVSGYPVTGTITTPVGSGRYFYRTLEGLEPGLRFHVKVELGTATAFTEWIAEKGDKNGDVSTACGCDSADLTGGPKSVSALQVGLPPHWSKSSSTRESNSQIHGKKTPYPASRRLHMRSF